MHTNEKTADVYGFRFYDPTKDTYDVRSVKATAETIALIGSEPIEGTAETVDAASRVSLDRSRSND